MARSFADTHGRRPATLRPTVRRFAAVTALASACAVCLVFASGVAEAQTTTTSPGKRTPRLPPTPAEQSRIPAGVDTGSPGTSDTLPLGTPVPPSNSADRGDLKMRSAAARAAARRPTPAPTTTPTEAGGATPTSADRLACANKPVDPTKREGGEPVALPGSGFTGTSASPKAAAAVAARPTGRVAC